MKQSRGIRTISDDSDNSEEVDFQPKDESNFNLFSQNYSIKTSESKIINSENQSVASEFETLCQLTGLDKKEPTQTIIYPSEYQNSQIFQEKNKLQFKPRPYQIRIYNEAKNKNSIIYMETGKGKTLIAIMLINDLFTRYKQMGGGNQNNKEKSPKVFFLVCDVALLAQQVEYIKQNTGLKVTILKGKSSKKSKNDYQEFRELIKLTDVFVAIPDVLYKLLSVGFVTIFDINMLIFDECHHCDSNHSYNLIMNEFYYYYYSDCKNRLPIILGLTASPLKTKIGPTIEETALKAMTCLCENLDSQMIIDPDLKVDDYNNSLIEDKAGEGSPSKNEYIQTESHLENPNYNTLYKFLNLLMIKPFLKFCFDKANKLSLSSEVNQINNDNGYDDYIKFIEKKFNTSDFGNYTKVITQNRHIYSKAHTSVVFRVFEKIQRNMYMLIESMNFDSIIKFFERYNLQYSEYNSFKDFSLDESESMIMEFDKLSLKEKEKLLGIFKTCTEKLKEAKERGFNYESDRLRKLKETLKEIFSTEESINQNRIIIFVSNRIVANFLEDILGQYLKEINPQLECLSVVGVNRKKTENNLVYDPKNSVNKLNENIHKFNSGKANVLIGTSTVEEGLDIQQCNIVMVFTELNTMKSYIQMKGRARKKNAMFMAFTNSREKTIKKINDFILLGNCMRNLFENDSIVRDFKKQNYAEMKKPSKSIFFLIENTHAKLSLRNIVPIFNETLQQLKNNQISISTDKQLIEKTTQKNNKIFAYHYQFRGTILENGKIEFTSEFCSDKQSAENYCLMEFEKYLYKRGIINDHFKIHLKNVNKY